MFIEVILLSYNTSSLSSGLCLLFNLSIIKSSGVYSASSLFAISFIFSQRVFEFLKLLSSSALKQEPCSGISFTYILNAALTSFNVSAAFEYQLILGYSLLSSDIEMVLSLSN